MDQTSGHVKCTGETKKIASLKSIQPGELRESEVIADTKTNDTTLRGIEKWRQIQIHILKHLQHILNNSIHLLVSNFASLEPGHAIQLFFRRHAFVYLAISSPSGLKTVQVLYSLSPSRSGKRILPA